MCIFLCVAGCSLGAGSVALVAQTDSSFSLMANILVEVQRKAISKQIGRPISNSDQHYVGRESGDRVVEGRWLL